MDERTRERFEAKIDRSGGPDACHPWTGCLSKKGYGCLRITIARGKRRTLGAHRIALAEKRGRPLRPGLGSLHTCPGGDNPACCNPKHLREGTNAENMKDRDERGRAAVGDRNGARLHRERLARGERHGRPVMTWELVREIRQEFVAGGTVRDIARRRGLARGTVRQILKYETWKVAVVIGPGVA